MTNEKLVRDNIPDIIRKDGIEPIVRIADAIELDRLLRLKITEEAHELLESGETEEVVDILEAIQSLLSLRAINGTTIEELQSKKREQRGGFKKGFVLQTED